MSTKLVYSTDENPNMHKQLGCMNGILQLFDRHHFVSGRRVNSHSHKRLPPGKITNHGTEHSVEADETQENFVKDIGREKQRVPIDSSRTSVSSSCSSNFSSVDCHKTAQQETSPTLPIKQPTTSLNLSPQALDLRDVVKDSMHRKARGLSVKTTANEEGVGRAMKHIDSPRPLLGSKSVQLKVNNSEGSYRALAKRQDSPKDASRFSCDGRESRMRSTVKLKELPRLSLDSRASSIRSSASESRSNYFSSNPQGQNGNSSQTLILNQEPGSNKRPSGVVARLMGLEAFPDSISTDEDSDIISVSSRMGDGSKQNQICGSQRVSLTDRTTSHLRKSNSVMKPTSNSKFPLEPAPWRQSDGSRGTQKQVIKYQEPPTKTQHPLPSVYGEIEKRLTELEFRKSGKDLRALKQILEAMQKRREMLENKKEEKLSNFKSQTSKCNPSYNRFDQGYKLITQPSHQSNHPFSPTKGTSPPKRCGSPIVIMKPDKQNEKPRVLDSSVIPAIDPTPRNNHLRDPFSGSHSSMDKNTRTRTLRSSRSSKVPQCMEESPTSFRRIYGTASPRLQQKKHTTEKGSSPTRKSKSKSTNLQQHDDLSSRFSAETRNSSRHDDTISMQSDSNVSWLSQIDTDVTSTYRTHGIDGSYQRKDPKDRNFEAKMSEDRSIAECGTAGLEQPSPISVLDVIFYGEDSPSPVKKISNVFKDDETLKCNEMDFDAVDIDHLINSTRPKLSSNFIHNRLENTKHLIHKLRMENPTCDEATIDHIASLCENTTPDHKYIAEILLASGFLKYVDPTTPTIQLHPGGHLINPNLYHVLEKNKGNTWLSNDEHNENILRSKSYEKVGRKLIFDTVNEILVQKFASAGSSEIWVFPNRPAGKSLRGEKLLKDIWSEMDHLQGNPDCSLVDENDDGLISILSKDMTNQSEEWAGHRGEIPGLVLDIERLIFKDLINEVVTGGAPGRHCRQLFAK